jgi:glutathione S-transferase
MARPPAEFTLHCFAQSGNCYKPALFLKLADLSLCGYLFWPEEIGADWNTLPNIRDWLARIQAEPRWVHTYRLMPGHPRLKTTG